MHLMADAPGREMRGVDQFVMAVEPKGVGRRRCDKGADVIIDSPLRRTEELDPRRNPKFQPHD